MHLPTQLLLLLAAARAGSSSSSAHGWWSYDATGQLITGQRGDPENPPPTLSAVLSPNVNGIRIGSNYSAADQPLAARGFLDVTKPPFSADPTGKTDATAAIQSAVIAAREQYLVVLLPKGSEFLVSETIAVVQPSKYFMSTNYAVAPDCNNMPEVYGKTQKKIKHCARTAPVMLVGEPVATGPRPTLRVAADTGLRGPVVYLHNPVNENINMNQVLSGIDIEIGHGNPDAIGAYGRAAQGTSIQDVTVRCADCAVGIQGGAGSGGSHINVRVEGGKLGLDLSFSQPSPTVTGVTLINQTVTAISYGEPGRQTLSVTGAHIQLAATAAGPAIGVTAQAISIVDSVIEAGDEKQIGISMAVGSNVFMQDVFMRGFGVHIVLPDGSVLPTNKTACNSWSHAKLIAAGRQQPQQTDSTGTVSDTLHAKAADVPKYTSPVFKNGLPTGDFVEQFSIGPDVLPPPPDLATRHTWNEKTFPSWFDKGACKAKDYGAMGDLVTDDTNALQKMLDAPECARIATLDKGYYAVSKTLELAAGQSLLGVSRIYSNIVPHSSVPYTIQPGEEPMPLLRTSSGATDEVTIGMLSVLIWRHMNSTRAVSFEAGKTMWRRAHTNRIDLSPGKIAPYAYYNQPLNVMVGHGGGQFYNFYQENWDSQGPFYRHLLVNGTDSPWSCYHCNTEHSQGEANLEISGTTAAIKIHGFKAEGNYVQVWVRDAASFWLQGYGGNASPFPFNCTYPPGYAQYPPSLLRIERTPLLLIANVITQAGSGAGGGRCGIFNTGFAGTFYDSMYWRSILETTEVSEEHLGTREFSTAPLLWPVLYTRGEW